MMQPDEKINILLVDDRMENLISLSAILERPDYNLITATSGHDALKYLLKHDFALILLDVQMPMMDGFETADLIKKREKTKHIPIIFVTALSADAPYLFRGYSAGAVDYIVKPFNPDILRSKVAVFADLAKKNIQLKKQSLLLRNQERLEREREVARIELESLKREQKSNEKYRDLVEGIKDGIVWVADLETLHFNFISPQAERILSIELFMRELIQHKTFIDYREKLLSSLKKTSPLKRDFSFEHQIKKSNECVVWMQTSMRIAEGLIPGRLELRGLSVDITLVKKAQEQAQSAIRVRDEFLSIASHELKTPLTPLCLQLDILEKMAEKGASKEELGERLIQYLNRFSRQTKRLNKLVDELLDISRMNNGQLILEKEDVSLRELTEEVCERFSVEIQRSGSSLRLNLSDNAHGFWDRMRIEQVLLNLLTNAIKYGDGKPIELSVRTTGSTAVLSIHDYGIGIKKRDQERIFHLYERAVSPMNFGGLGMGLYIVRQIVEAHGGKITLESEVSKGSTFTVYLPMTYGPQKRALSKYQPPETTNLEMNNQ